MKKNAYEAWMNQWMEFLAPMGAILNDLRSTDSDTSWATAALHAITFLSTGEPGPVHFAVVKDFLEKELSKNKNAINLLSKELALICNKLRSFIIENTYIDEWIDKKRPCSSEYTEGFLMPGRQFLQRIVYEKDGHNLLDYLLSQFLRKQGDVGIEAADKVLESSFKRHGEYKKSGYKADLRNKSWGLWIPEKQNGRRSIFGKWLELLAEIAWLSSCRNRFERIEKKVPALTRSVHPSVLRILSPQNTLETTSDQALILHDGQAIATSLPTIPPALIPLVIKGADQLSSIYHARLLRFECRQCFNNLVLGIPDFRVLRFEGGHTELAQTLGFKSREAIGILKVILHAQAYMDFPFDDGTGGNLISLCTFTPKGHNRREGLEITVGTRLLPNYTFRTNGNHLLVPVPEEPPFVSSDKYHSGQSLLQMMIMEEFSKNSIEFSEQGSILIPECKWSLFAQRSSLPATVLERTKDRWVRDGNDGPQFLATKERDRYFFGPSYKRESDFLSRQGQLRKRGQARGIRSANAKKHKLQSRSS